MSSTPSSSVKDGDHGGMVAIVLSSRPDEVVVARLVKASDVGVVLYRPVSVGGIEDGNLSVRVTNPFMSDIVSVADSSVCMVGFPNPELVELYVEFLNAWDANKHAKKNARALRDFAKEVADKTSTDDSHRDHTTTIH